MRDSYSNYIRNTKINEEKIVAEVQKSNGVSKIHYNQMIIDSNAKQKKENNLSTKISKKLKIKNNKTILAEANDSTHNLEEDKKLTKSRNKIQHNHSLKNLKQLQESPYFTNFKLENSNSSGKIPKQKFSGAIRKDKPLNKITKYSKFSKENQLISCIQNISPFLSKNITNKDIKTNRHINEGNPSPQRKNNHTISNRNEPKLQTNITQVESIKATQKKEERLLLSERKIPQNLPPIIIESDSNFKEFTTEKNIGSRSILPEFRSPHIINKQLFNFNNGGKSRRSKQWISRSPIEDQIHQNSFLSSKSSVSKNIVHRNKRLNHQPSLSTSACDNTLNAQHLVSLTPLGGVPISFGNSKDQNESMITKLTQITQIVSDNSVSGITINSKLNGKLRYVSKRDMESKMFMPILQEKNKFSYLYDDLKTISKSNISNKVVDPVENSFNLNGVKVLIGNNK